MFLAGRHMPIWVGVLTMTATWVGGGYINGTAESVYKSGLVWTQAPWGYALSLMIGGLFFAGIMRKRRYTTLLDPFEQAYGKEVSALLFIPALIGEIFWSAAILSALGMTFATILQTDTTWAIIISAAVAIAYTSLGGLWSVAYTDVVQIIFIGAGLLIAIPYALDANDGWSIILEGYRQSFGSDANFFPDFWEIFSGGNASIKWGESIWYWLDLGLLLMFGGIPWGVYFQRVLSAPSARTARNLSLMAGVLCFAMAIPAIIIGMVGKSIDWMALTGLPAPDPAMILPAVLLHATPTWVGILGLSVVAAAVMSSIDSSILSGSTMLTWNIIRPWAKKPLTDRNLTLCTKIGVIVLGIAATMMALSVQSVYALWSLCADLVYVVLFPQLVLVLYARQMHRVGAISGLVVGLILRLGGGEPTLGIPSFINYPMMQSDGTSFFPFRTLAMMSCLVTAFGVSLLIRAWETPRSTLKKSINTRKLVNQKFG